MHSRNYRIFLIYSIAETMFLTILFCSRIHFSCNEMSREDPKFFVLGQTRVSSQDFIMVQGWPTTRVCLHLLEKIEMGGGSCTLPRYILNTFCELGGKLIIQNYCIHDGCLLEPHYNFKQMQIVLHVACAPCTLVEIIS